MRISLIIKALVCRLARLRVQEALRFKKNIHTVERLVRVAYAYCVVNIRAARSYSPALGDCNAEIGGFVFLGLHRFCRRLRNLYAVLGLYGFCAVAVCYGLAAASGKAKRKQGGKYFVFIDIHMLYSFIRHGRHCKICCNRIYNIQRSLRS